MTASEIKEKYGIGTSRLYKMWREADKEREIEREAQKAERLQPETDALLHQMRQRIKELETAQRQPREDLETRSLPEIHGRGDRLPEYNNRLLLDMNKKLDDIVSKLQTIHDYVEYSNEVLDWAQEEVESVADDVEDIEEKVDDVKSNTLPKLSDVVETMNAVERMLSWGMVLIPAALVLYKTLKNVRRKDEDSFSSPKPPTKPSKAEPSMLEKVFAPKKDDDMYTI